MSTEIRELTSADRHRHAELMEQAFGRGRVVPPPAPDATPSDMRGTWGIFENGQLRAAAGIGSFPVYWGSQTVLTMGGIGGVATFAEARGRGYVEQLLRRTLEAMRDSGQVISGLFPFAWAFYRKQGWDWVGERHNMKLPLSEIRSYPEGKQVVCLTGIEARPRLESAYTTFGKRYHGMFTAETHRWQDKLRHSDNRTTYVYLYEPTGEYFCWRYDSQGEEGNCHDFVVYTPEGYRALLSTLHYLGTQLRTARVMVPVDSALWSFVYHWNLNTETRPVFMGRVVDFAMAMSQISVSPDVPDGSATLRLVDEQAPWNAGIWRIAVEDGKLTCTSVIGNSEADLATDIQAISQAFWGTPNLTRLRQAGRLQVSNEAGFSWLCNVLPSAPVYMLDDF